VAKAAACGGRATAKPSSAKPDECTVRAALPVIRDVKIWSQMLRNTDRPSLGEPLPSGPFIVVFQCFMAITQVPAPAKSRISIVKLNIYQHSGLPTDPFIVVFPCLMAITHTGAGPAKIANISGKASGGQGTAAALSAECDEIFSAKP
jgi:hypothetical protein